MTTWTVASSLYLLKVNYFIKIPHSSGEMVHGRPLSQDFRITRQAVFFRSNKLKAKTIFLLLLNMNSVCMYFLRCLILFKFLNHENGLSM